MGKIFYLSERVGQGHTFIYFSVLQIASQDRSQDTIKSSICDCIKQIPTPPRVFLNQKLGLSLTR